MSIYPDKKHVKVVKTTDKCFGHQFAGLLKIIRTYPHRELRGTIEMGTKTLLALLTLAVLTTEASAQSQSRSFYDASGRNVGRSVTDNRGASTTYYDAAGRMTGRSTTDGKTTTFYDAAGRNVGRATK
jgi:YD repeat-containing protein